MERKALTLLPQENLLSKGFPLSTVIIRGKSAMSNPILNLPCPYSQSLYGLDPATNKWILLPIRCRRWTCDHCWIANEISLKEKVLSGKPERMITFTARPNPGEYPRAMHKRIRPAIGRLYAILRKENGPLEAVTFLELHKSGFPHYHALQRGTFIPWKLLRDHWLRLTGSFKVDIRAVRERDEAGRYVTKYVTKQLREIVCRRLGRVVNFTRNYLPKDSHEKAPKTIKWTYDKAHPAEVLRRVFNDAPWRISGNVIDIDQPGTIQEQAAIDAHWAAAVAHFTEPDQLPRIPDPRGE